MRITRHTDLQCIGSAKQTGVVLLITLIVLVAMTLAAIALMRSVDTTNIIAGNLAFQRSTLLAADAGIEAAVTPITGTLAKLVATTKLTSTFCAPGTGYKSWYEPDKDPNPNNPSSWDALWASFGSCPATLPTDALGNSVSYMIESMCNANGQVGCLFSPVNLKSLSCAGQNVGKQKVSCPPIVTKYYRVTSRASGPRNSVAYVQVIVAM